jgi:hypothetical protein
VIAVVAARWRRVMIGTGPVLRLCRLRWKNSRKHVFGDVVICSVRLAVLSKVIEKREPENRNERAAPMLRNEVLNVIGGLFKSETGSVNIFR